MLNLIMKDIKVIFNRKGIIFYIIYMPVLLFIFSGNDNFSTRDGVYFFTTILVFLNLLNVFSQDERNKSFIMINSLPVKKREVVIARYLSVFVNLILMILIASVGIGIASTLGIFKVSVLYIWNNSSVLKMIGLILSFTAIAFPMYFKLGVIKGKLINFIIYIMFFSVQGIVYSTNVNIPFLINKLFIIISLIVFILSLLISIKIYENKDI